MKEYILFICLLFFSSFIVGQTSKTINVTTSGTLKSLITTSEANSITNLTVSGNIDARDVAFMRDNIQYLAVLDLSTAKIKAYTGIDGTYSLSTISYPANEMPLCSFYNASTIAYKYTLNSIKLPTTITSIGGSAFYYCYGLSGTFSIPGTVNSIGSYALYGCIQISSYSVETTNTRYSSNNGVLFNKKQDSLFICPTLKSCSYSIPQTVTYIGSSAFEGCSYLTGSLTIPTSVKSIGSYAFYYCSGFTGDLTIPAGVTTIEDGTFYGCSGLNGIVTIPKSVLSIGSYSFFECNKLTSFQVDVQNAKYSSNNNVLFSKIQDSLFICPSGKTGNFSMPATVKVIGSYAFYNCSGLTGSLVIPKLVHLIGSYAFYGCNLLTAYEVDPLNSKYLSNSGVLFNKNQDTLLVCPAGKSGSYSIPTTVKNIGTGSFYYCSNLTGTINMPASVNSIGDYAFYGCSKLSGFEVDPANSNYSSGDGILFNRNKDSLFICPLSKTGKYQIPISVTTIDNSAFDGCSALTEIAIPISVTSIGDYAFEYCTGLTEIILPKNITTLGIGSFYGCSNLQKVSILKQIPTAIEYYCFDLVDKTTCKLLVPMGSKIAYQITNYWKDFILISETDFTDIKAIKVFTNAVKIFPNQSKIIIEGLQKGDLVKVFEVEGKQLFSVVSSERTISIDAKKGECYFVKVNDKTTKIIL
jgi:hypothetical protein